LGAGVPKSEQADPESAPLPCLAFPLVQMVSR